MPSWAFVASLGLALAGLFAWGFRVLPAERWQVLAAVPLRRTAAGRFKGANLTWYGVFTAFAATVAAATFLVLAGALGLSAGASGGLAALILLIGFGASRATARLVERRRHTASVGGGVFVAFLALPVLLAAAERLGVVPQPLPRLPLLAAVAVAYVLGEAVGRLACISFGCCYGKPLDELGPAARRLLAPIAFRFEGATKKIAYASRLGGVAVVPIQAISAVVLAVVGLASLALMLDNRPGAACLLAVAGSQLWRLASETLRADFRGGGKLSAYQIMAFLTTLLTLLFVALLPGVESVRPELAPHLTQGLGRLWDPAVILALQALWLGAFLWSGWSQVTGSSLALRVYRSRVTAR